MAFCETCGTEIKEGEKFCDGCGAAVEANNPAVEENKTEATSTSTIENKASETFEKFNNTPDSTADFDQKDITENKVMAILAYFGPLVLVPILAAPKSKFSRFHANQGLVLLIADILYGVAVSILTGIIWSISWRLGSLLSPIFGLGWLLFSILAILGIINAAQGKAKELPVIGKIKLLK